jgi:hypothetical protein
MLEIIQSENSFTTSYTGPVGCRSLATGAYELALDGAS